MLSRRKKVSHIILIGPEGERRIEAGKPYNLKPGEVITGTTIDLPVRVEKKPQTPGQSALTKKLVEQVDSRLNKLAGLLGFPAARLIHIMAKAIGVPQCAACQLRYQILKKAKELGWRKVIWLTYQSVKAQIQVDENQLEEIAKEVKK